MRLRSLLALPFHLVAMVCDAVTDRLDPPVSPSLHPDTGHQPDCAAWRGEPYTDGMEDGVLCVPTGQPCDCRGMR